MLCYIHATVLMRKVNGAHEDVLILPDRRLLEGYLHLFITLLMLTTRPTTNGTTSRRGGSQEPDESSHFILCVRASLACGRTNQRKAPIKVVLGERQDRLLTGEPILPIGRKKAVLGTQLPIVPEPGGAALAVVSRRLR